MTKDMFSFSTKSNIGKMRYLSTTLLCLLICMTAFPQLLTKEQLNQYPIYTSLEEALQNPAEVYRFKWKGKIDSLPENFFQLTNLQELTLSKCRLISVNQQIGKLKNLQYLNVAHNRLVGLPETIGQLKHLKSLIVNRNMIGCLPESIGELHELTYIDAWDNPMYELPESIANLQNTLKTIDLRQIALHNDELDKMEKMLPHTDIKITSTCDCNDGRDD